MTHSLGTEVLVAHGVGYQRGTVIASRPYHVTVRYPNGHRELIDTTRHSVKAA